MMCSHKETTYSGSHYTECYARTNVRPVTGAVVRVTNSPVTKRVVLGSNRHELFYWTRKLAFKYCIKN